MLAAIESAGNRDHSPKVRGHLPGRPRFLSLAETWSRYLESARQPLRLPRLKSLSHQPCRLRALGPTVAEPVAATPGPQRQDGPAGFGPPDFIAPSAASFPYRIDFENDPTATAPAQRVDGHRPARPQPRLEHLPADRGRLRRHAHHHPGRQPALPDDRADDLQRPDVRRRDRAGPERRHRARSTPTSSRSTRTPSCRPTS